MPLPQKIHDELLGRARQIGQESKFHELIRAGADERKILNWLLDCVAPVDGSKRIKKFSEFTEEDTEAFIRGLTNPQPRID